MMLTPMASCKATLGPHRPNLEGDQRLVERKGRQVIEEGRTEGGVRIGTWRYSDPGDNRVVEEVDYHQGQILRSRAWMIHQIIVEYESDGGIWVGFGYQGRREGRWIHWTADHKVDCERSGLYHHGKLIQDFETLGEGPFRFDQL